MVGTVAISSFANTKHSEEKDRLQIEKTVGDSFSIALLIPSSFIDRDVFISWTVIHIVFWL